MIKLKALLLLLIFVLTTAACMEQKAAPTAASLPDTKENRLAAAKKYLQVVTPQELLQDLTARAVPKMPEKKRVIFNEVMASQTLLDFTQRVALATLVKHFTANELQAMATFYSTPEGKAIRHKMGPYMADLIPQIVKELIRELQAKEKAQAPKTPQPGATPAKPAPPKAAAPQKPQGKAQPVAPAPPKAQSAAPAGK